MQFLPVSATETVIREISYALPDDRREMKAARHLNWRINRRVNAEDTELITPRPARHAVAELCRGAAGDERSVPAELRAEAQAADSGGAAGAAAAAGVAARELTRRMTSAERQADAPAATRHQHAASAPTP